MSHKLLKLIAFILSLSLSLTVQAADKKDVSPEDQLNPSNLSGGIVHMEGYYLPRGLEIAGELRTPIDTRINKVGDVITMQTTEDLLIGDYNIVPGTSFIHGYISRLEKPGRMFKKPKVEITFDKISIPTDKGRRDVYITGKVTATEFIGNSKAVNNATPFKRKAAMAAGAGAVVGAGGALATTGLTSVYNTFGISTMLTRATMLGGAGVGALAGAALVKRDDARIESGTQLKIVLEEPTMHAAHQEAVPDYEKEGIKSIEDAYDKYQGLKSEKL